MSNTGPSSGNSRGWTLLLSFAGKASRRAALSGRKRELRSCLWLRDHDPIAVDGLLEAALLRSDNKTKLVASGTLLAAADALAQAFSSFDSGTPSSASTKKPSRHHIALAMVTASDELLLRELAVSLAERFAPLLTAIAQGTAPAGEALPLRTSSAPSGGGGVGGADGGRAHGVVTPAAKAAAAAASTPPVGEAPKSAPAAVAARPTALTGFAAEGALALISVAALVASSSPRPAAAAPTEGSGSAAAPLLAANEAPTGASRSAAVVSSENSPIEQPGDGSAGEPPPDKVEVEAGGTPMRQRALGVLSALLPASIVPLLRLAEAWLGGGIERAPATAPAGETTATAEVELTVSWDEDGGGIEAGGLGVGSRAVATVGLNGAAAVAAGVGEARGLAVMAVRDLAALIIAGVDVSRAVRERQAERMRVLERDGLEERILATQEDPLCSGLVEHAAWHLARTVPVILRNRRWPTAKLKAGGRAAAEGQQGGRAVGGIREPEISEIEELVEELRACDPRLLEMAGIEPPQGVEEGRWLALRKLCLCVASAKAKDLLRSTYHGGRGGGGGEGVGRAVDDGDRGGGVGLMGVLQEALIRSLCGSRPEAQQLGASALVWVMSTALRDRCTGNVAASRSDHPEGRIGVGVDVRPLVGLMGQEEGDAASEAVRLVLTGLALERPLAVIPEVLRAAVEAVAFSPGEPSAAAPSKSAASTARLNLTLILADTIRGVRGSPFLSALPFHPPQGGCLSREDEVGGFGFAKGASPFDAVGDVGDHLIQCLNSDDLRVRKTASRGLVSLDPGWVIPRLCQRLAVLPSARESGQWDQDRGLGVSNGIGGAGWGVRGRSACLQALGDVIVLGRDPPSALSALLDSLRNQSHAALDGHRHSNRTQGRGDGDVDGDAGSGDGDGDGGSGKGDKKGEGGASVDRVMSSLPLWARRLKERSDRCERLALSRYVRGKGAPPLHSPCSNSSATRAGATAAPVGVSSSAASLEAEEVEDDNVDDGNNHDNESEPIPAETAAAHSSSPTLFGECLEVAAVKALAAPGEPVPVRFFAILATAAASSTDETAAATIPPVLGPPPSPSFSLPRTCVLPVPPPVIAGTDASQGSANPTEEASAGSSARSGGAAEAAAAAAAAAAAVAAIGEGTACAGTKLRRRGRRKRPVEPPRRSTLVGVLDMVRRRMSGQTRLSAALLGDESDEASQRVQALLFSRLTPLLLLNVLPAGVLVAEDVQQQRRQREQQQRLQQSMGTEFREEGPGSAEAEAVGGCLEDIRGLLLERTERVYEYDEVQKISAEVAGILPPRLVLPGVVSRLCLFSEAVEAAEGGGEVKGSPPGNHEDDAVASPGTLASRALFTACYAATNHGELVGPWVGGLLSAVVRIALLPATRDTGDEVVQVQHAAINCLAILLQTSAQAAHQKTKTDTATGTPRPIALPADASRSAVSPATRACATEEPPTPTEARSRTSHTITAESALEAEDAVAAAAADGSTLVAGAVGLESSESKPESAGSAVGDVTIGDVPGFVATIAVGGILPRMYSEGGGGRGGGGWLQAALSEAFRREGEETGGGDGSGEASLPAQLRMCFANAVVTASRRCPPEFLPALCRRGNLLGRFLTGASHGGGLIRAAFLQAVFALVYRTKDVFGDGGRGGAKSVNHTCDDVMQVACDALDKDQHPEVRVSGLKLLLGVVAAGASPSAAAAASRKGSPTPIHETPEPLISDLGPGESGDTAVHVSDGRRSGGAGRGLGSGPRVFEPQGRQQGVGRGDNHAGEGAGTSGILSPAVVSRAKRLLVGVSNIDESADVRRLAAQALAALGGTASP